jgi:hypothetical protein
VLHAILQASLFGHLNRMADAVGVDCDYPDSFGAPRQEPATPHYRSAGASHEPHETQPIDLALHAGAVERMGAWQRYVLERDAPLTRHQRQMIATAVATRLGDASMPAVAPDTALERALVDLADIVTLAPWRLGPAAFAPVRNAGLPADEDIFDAVATASSCTVFSRVRVALAALGK